MLLSLLADNCVLNGALLVEHNVALYLERCSGSVGSIHMDHCIATRPWNVVITGRRDWPHDPATTDVTPNRYNDRPRASKRVNKNKSSADFYRAACNAAAVL